MPKPPIKAYKHGDGPIRLIPLLGDKHPIYEIIPVGPAETTAGPMVKVRLTTRTNLADPSVMPALIAGHYQLKHTRYEVWAWGNPLKFWAKAFDHSTGEEWHKQKCFLLYEVELLREG